MKQIFRASLLFFIPFIFACQQNSVFISPNNPSIEYMGRIEWENPDRAELYWSGTSIKINFEGTSVKAVLDDETGDNYYNVIIDNDSLYILKPEARKRSYTLVGKLPDGKHSVELFKRTEWNRGKAWFYGFELEAGSKILPAREPRKRKIEFYGNSITAGYGVEDFVGDSPDSIYTNNYLSYSNLTAQYFEAHYHCICRSGIGIMISWDPPIMPEIYDRIDPLDPESKWDFTQYTPDVVVINLFQNDSWLFHRPDKEVFGQRFGTEPPKEDFIVESYKKFVQTIREKYSDAHIICMLGTMDITREGSPWPGYIEQAVTQLNDEKIYTHFIPYKDTPGHPKVDEQQEMAESLIGLIEEKVGW